MAKNSVLAACAGCDPAGAAAAPQVYESCFVCASRALPVEPAHRTPMTTHPSADQPRSHGRFAERRLHAVDLELTVPTDAWPTPETDPRHAQVLFHEIAWDTSRTDSERLLAARGAIACARELGGGRPSTIPPSDEADGYLTQGCRDDDLLLDSVLVVGPPEPGRSANFGAELSGIVYDRTTAMRDDRAAADALRKLATIKPFGDEFDQERQWELTIAAGPPSNDPIRGGGGTGPA